MLTKAQAALPVVAGTQNVIIFLSDGDFNASASAVEQQDRQGHEAVRPGHRRGPGRDGGGIHGLRRRLWRFDERLLVGRHPQSLHDDAGDRLRQDQVLHDEHRLPDDRLAERRYDAAVGLPVDHDDTDQAAAC